LKIFLWFGEERKFKRDFGGETEINSINWLMDNFKIWKGKFLIQLNL